MTIEQLVTHYIDAWNRRDVDRLLELMHPGAAYYDAFWMETCVGPHLRQYFKDSLREEPYRYEVTGDIITTPEGCVLRYHAYNRCDSMETEPVFQGAEVLTLRDGRVLTVSDFYCIPHREELEEIAGVVATRHGVPAFTDFGLGAFKALRVRTKLTDSFENTGMYLDPDITASQIAEALDCTLEQLSVVIEKEFGTSVDGLLDARRVDCAKRLLKGGRGDSDIVRTVASQCGFKSYRAFADAFTKIVGVDPVEYCAKARTGRGALDIPPWH